MKVTQVRNENSSAQQKFSLSASRSLRSNVIPRRSLDSTELVTKVFFYEIGEVDTQLIGSQMYAACIETMHSSVLRSISGCKLEMTTSFIQTYIFSIGIMCILRH